MLRSKTVKRGAMLKRYMQTFEGTNTPTCFEEYPCPCGKGRIVREFVPGFEDDFMTLECSECLKTYTSTVDRSGSDLLLYIKD